MAAIKTLASIIIGCESYSVFVPEDLISAHVLCQLAIEEEKEIALTTTDLMKVLLKDREDFQKLQIAHADVKKQLAKVTKHTRTLEQDLAKIHNRPMASTTSQTSNRSLALRHVGSQSTPPMASAASQTTAAPQ